MESVHPDMVACITARQAGYIAEGCGSICSWHWAQRMFKAPDRKEANLGLGLTCDIFDAFRERETRPRIQDVQCTTTKWY